jgi:uncharacterized protein YqeY
MSVFKEKIRSNIATATKLKKEPAKNVLKVVLGEIDTQEARLSRDLTDEEVYKVIRKTLQGIEEMLQYKPGDVNLEIEKVTLEHLLPKKLDYMDILLELSPKIEELKQAKSDGQATGIAMKLLKEKKLLVEGNDVAQVVKGIRNGQTY